MGLFARFKKPVERRPSAPAGAVIYAIGDVHGRLDLLRQLTDAILADIGQHPPGQKPEIVFVGDYVDRGRDSAGVIEHIIALRARTDIVVHTLKGNHEEAMLGFLADSSGGPVWAEFGGVETLASYGVASPAVRSDMEGWEAARQAFRAKVPVSHVHFLHTLDLYRVSGDYVFVHAGLKPGVPLERQSERDLLWIRSEFLETNRAFEKVVVYGHTPRPDAAVEVNRIGIDTGAFVTGVLTALKLEGESQSLMQTAPANAAAPVSFRTVS
jgi:serine/threonine protein phosphatase 1